MEFLGFRNILELIAFLQFIFEFSWKISYFLLIITPWPSLGTNFSVFSNFPQLFRP
jgi:hypothetical protein